MRGKAATSRVLGTSCLTNRRRTHRRGAGRDQSRGPIVGRAVDLLGFGSRGKGRGAGRERLRSMLRKTSSAVLWAGLAVLLSLISTPAGAQPWPAKPITVVNGFPAGSGTDIVLRMYQGALEQELGVALVFEYKPGAGGNVGSEYVSRAAPDGYTLLIGTAGTHSINPALYKKLPFDVEADFTPLATLANVANVLAVNPAVLDAKSVKEFIEIVKAAPGKFNYSSTGNGASTHLGFAQFNAVAGLQMEHVPFKGSPESIQALVTGEVCCSFAQVQTVLGQWKAGKVRLLGVSSKSRIGIYPDVPTIDEAGLPGFESVTWYGLFAPKGLDGKLAERINAAVRKAQESPALVEKITGIGTSVRSESLEQFRATVKTDRVKWAEIVRTSGAKID
jgi:tripartite-type tricarboxylate transporter receptor subunit TctC